MTLRKYSEIDKNLWNKFVERSSEAWLYHESCYLDFAIEDGANSLSFALLTDTGEIQAICPLYLITSAMLSDIKAINFLQKCIRKLCRLINLPEPWSIRTLSTGYSGIAIKGGVSRRNMRKNVREVVEQLDSIAKKQKADFLEVRNVDMVDGNEDGTALCAMLVGGGMHEIAHIPNRLFSRIDLNKDEKEIWAGIDEDCRAEINRAKREGVQFEADPVNGFERFYAIHSISWDRTMGLHIPKEHFINMEKHLLKYMHFFIATHEGQDIAAIMLHCYKNSIFYYSAGSKLESQKVKPNNFVLYNSILWGKAQGYHWFGVGIFDAHCGKNEKEYRVGQYKAQFSAAHFPVAEYRKYYTKKSLSMANKERKDLLKSINKAGKK